MKAVLQRVTSASVTVDGSTIGAIDGGLLVLLGVQSGDESGDLDYVVNKTLGLRIFADEAGKMNRSVVDIGGSVLVVSQFTLYGDARKGNRPSYGDAARPEVAAPLIDTVVERLLSLGAEVATGRFGADMAVELINDGPVTISLELV
mgnify:CR=1 FL=1